MPKLAPRPHRELECDVLADIREALGLEPGLVLMRNGQAFGEVWDEKTGTVRRHHGGLGAGSADLVGCLDGRFFALEVKRRGQRSTPEQVAWAAMIRAVGGFVAEVHDAGEARAAVAGARDETSLTYNR